MRVTLQIANPGATEEQILAAERLKIQQRETLGRGNKNKGGTPGHPRVKYPPIPEVQDQPPPAG